MRFGRAMPVLLVLSASTGLNAQDKEPEPITVGVSISLTSETLGEERSIRVYTPPGYDQSDERYPVLYLLDGEYSFHFTIGIIDFLSKIHHIPEMLVVGIVNVDRTRDYTPEPGEKERARFPRSGGADAFTAFVKQELVPFIDTNYRTEPYRILSGHSLGGLFTVRALLTTGDLFGAFIAGSPSLYWNDQAVIQLAEMSLDNTFDRTLFFSMGDERDEMVNGTNALSETLRAHAPTDIEWRYDRMAGEDHSTTPFVTMYKGLEFIYTDYYSTDNLGSMSFRDYNDRMTSKYGYDIVLPLGFLFSVGGHFQKRSCGDFADLAAYWHAHYPGLFARLTEDWLAEANGLVAKSEYECAISLYHLVTKVDEQNFEAYKGMGDAHLSAGDRTAALVHYQAALQLRPSDQDLRQTVEDLSNRR